jgi:hypothetical protein
VTIKATVEAAHVPWRPLGELFVSRGLISEGELETALSEQAATGKRLGEILVDGGLVSGPDLTSALMDQLGVEISKEEGFGSGLWAEIKRRHKRVRPDGEDIDDGMRPDQSLLHVVEDEEPEEPEVEYDHAVEPDPEPEPFTPPPAAAAVPEPFEAELVAAEPLEPEAEPFEPEPELVEFEREPAAPEVAEVAFAAATFEESEPIETEPFVLADPELEHELEEIKAEYAPPAPIESFSEPEPEAQDAFEPEHQFAEPELVEYEPVPAPIVAVEPVPEPQPEPAPAADEPVEPMAHATVAEYDDTTELRAELDEARAELKQLQEMLADAMTALTALSAEAAGKPYES